ARRAAADIFRKAAERHRSAPAWINLAETLLELGQVDAALRAARTANLLGDVAWRDQAQAVLARAQTAAVPR
ncbi:MAG: hypothetical protein ABIO45_14905, partial [Burkholderiaceae bacterium]